MPRVDFIEGIQCRKCGHIVAEPTIFSKELCQECGARIMDISVTQRVYAPAEYGEAIAVNRTRKLFYNTLERVN